MGKTIFRAGRHRTIDGRSVAFSEADLAAIAAAYDAAVQLLISKGFTCTKVEKENDGTHTAGIVIATTPEPNKDYEKGKEIFLQVWGEEPTTEGSVLGDLMPNLFG